MGVDQDPSAQTANESEMWEVMLSSAIALVVLGPGSGSVAVPPTTTFVVFFKSSEAQPVSSIPNLRKNN